MSPVAFRLFRIGLMAPVLGLSACMNPMVAVKPKVEKFKKENPGQILVFQGKTKTMRYAWSGNPSLRPLLFVHGSPGSWEAWVHFLSDPDLQQNFQVFAVDRPGYGGSDPGRAETSLKNQAADMLEVLKFNRSGKKAILVGHSFGGPVIARAAMDFPNQIAGLIFVAASVSPDLEKTKWYQYPASWWPIRSLIPTDLRVCNEEILPLKAELEKMMDGWKSITAKTYIIQGASDELVPPANEKFLTEHLSPQIVVKTLMVPDLNHFIPWKRPDLILSGIREVNDVL